MHIHFDSGVPARIRISRALILAMLVGDIDAGLHHLAPGAQFVSEHGRLACAAVGHLA